MRKQVGYLGVDQYGQTYMIEKSPRKELLEQLGATYADKMYCDTTDGKTKHKGYIISRLWIDVYAVHEWKAAV